MMFYSMVWLFFCYGFLGWVMETAAATARSRHFVNRGLLDGPLCAIYGFAGVMLTMVLPELRGNWLFLFLGSAIWSTVFEWIAGHILERSWYGRWWDYSSLPLNLDGYICKEPVYRKTPLGREIADLLLAVNRPYGKSDYIPCICWGRNARYASGFQVGIRVRIWGRVQSREYTKRLSDTECEKRVAYEVSVSKLECVDG